MSLARRQHQVPQSHGRLCAQPEPRHLAMSRDDYHDGPPERRPLALVACSSMTRGCGVACVSALRRCGLPHMAGGGKGLRVARNDLMALLTAMPGLPSGGRATGRTSCMHMHLRAQRASAVSEDVWVARYAEWGLMPPGAGVRLRPKAGWPGAGEGAAGRSTDSASQLRLAVGEPTLMRVADRVRHAANLGHTTGGVALHAIA